MLIDKSEIQELLPQRAPFVMVDNLLFASTEKFETSFLIERDNLFVNDEMLSESAVIENIAQRKAILKWVINSIQLLKF